MSLRPSLPRIGVILSSVVAAVALLALPAWAAPAASRPCPDGLARVASWEPIEVAGNVATVAFVLAPGCHDVDMSLVSYQIHSGRGAAAAVLQADTGHFSAGMVHRLNALVGSDCAFRVVFAVGRPEAARRTGAAVESAMQAPDPCMYGADPVVITGASLATPDSVSTTSAPSTTTPPTTPPTTAPTAETRTTVGQRAPVPPVSTAAPATRPEPVAEPDTGRAAAKRPARAVATTAGATAAAAAPESTATARTISGLASEPVSAIGVGPSGPLAGWDAASLLGVALLTVGVGTALLWLTHPGHPRDHRG